MKVKLGTTAKFCTIIVIQTLIWNAAIGIVYRIRLSLNNSNVKIKCPCIIDGSVSRGAAKLTIKTFNRSLFAVGKPFQLSSSRTILNNGFQNFNFNQTIKYALNHFYENNLYITFINRIGRKEHKEHLFVSLYHKVDRSVCPIMFPEHPPLSVLSRNEEAYDIQETSSHIVGGAESSFEIAAYLVLFTTATNNGSSRTCTGTMLAPTLVVTAAHCKLSHLTVVIIGTDDPNTATWEHARVKYFVPHPKFNISNGVSHSSRYDIAYVRIEGYVPSHVRFMKIQTRVSDWSYAPNARILGYGILEPQLIQSNPSLRLHQVDVPLLSGSSCNKVYKQLSVNVVDSKQICGGYKNRNCGACNGDSGGPLLQYDKNQEPVLIGVTSASYKCGSGGYPTLFVRVSAFKGFLPLAEVGNTSGQGTASTNSVGKSKVGLEIGLLTGIGALATVGATVFLLRFYRSRQNQ